MGTTTLETPAWLMRGVITYNAKLGTLRLSRGRLGFRETGADAAVFDIPLDEIGNVHFPFYNLGSVVRFDAGGSAIALRSSPRSEGSSGRAHGSATSAPRAAGVSSGKQRF